MTDAQWESLCDGCGKCCLIRLQEAPSEPVYTTRVACRLLDLNTCRCSDYPGRFAQVPSCEKLTPAKARDLSWLPDSCAYVKVARGEALEAWHPLVSGRRESVHEAGASVRGAVISEDFVDEEDLEWFID